jgi:hypothetical protein
MENVLLIWVAQEQVEIASPERGGRELFLGSLLFQDKVTKSKAAV